MSDDSRKYELECLRLAADCKGLSRMAVNPELKQHFHQMGEEWTAKAERGSNADIKSWKPTIEIQTQRALTLLH